jgi:hypothetical protein
MAHWPAKKNWNNIDYLLRVAGDRTVPVEVITLINKFVIMMHGSSSSLKNKLQMYIDQVSKLVTFV